MLFQKIKEEEILLNSNFEASIALMSKPDRNSTHACTHTHTYTEGENYKLISFMSIDANFKTKYQQMEFSNI